MNDGRDARDAGAVPTAPPSPFPPKWMDQTQASALRASLGVKLAPKTLQKRRVTGDSPPFRKVMGRVIYEHDELVAWAAAQLANAPRVNSTSELSSMGRLKKAAGPTCQ